MTELVFHYLSVSCDTQYSCPVTCCYNYNYEPQIKIWTYNNYVPRDLGDLQMALDLGDAKEQQQAVKATLRAERYRRHEVTPNDMKARLPRHLQRSANLASEKGSSSWATTLPIADHGFALHKGAFRDALCLRYGWTPPRLPCKCACGASFSTSTLARQAQSML